MNLLARLAQTPVAEAIGWTLLHSLWQGALIAVALFVLIRTTRDPRVRYGGAVAGLIAMAAVFGATLLVVWPGSTPGPAGMLVVAGTAWITPAGGTGGGGGWQWFRDELVRYLPLAWGAGVCLSQLWQIAGFLSVRRMRRRGAWSAPERWTAELERLRGTLRVSRPVLLLESLLVDAPVVLGHLRPAILMPAGLLTGVPAGQIEAMLLHELAHIRRCDYLVNLCHRWLEGLFFYHPAVWWMSHVIRAERENCCDDAVLRVTGDAHQYASALAALEAKRSYGGSPALAATGGSLRQRIERILRRNPPPGMSGVVAAITVILTTAAIAAAGWQASGTRQASAVPATASEAQSTPYRKWLSEDVAYIIAEAERSAFLRLRTDQEREMFIEQFWLRRDGKAEHYRRIAYANERFASQKTPGWKTDRGRIYIVWGPPDEIESHPNPPGGARPREEWRYRGGSWFQFVDAGSDGEYRLTNHNAPVATGTYNRLVRWTITDPQNRFVTGLDRSKFTIRENGVTQSLTYFAPPGSPIAVAVVSEAGIAGLDSIPVYRLIQTRTVIDAIRQLEASGGSRKALVVVSPEGDLKAPPGIEVLRTTPDSALKAVVEVSNQYVAGFQSQSADAVVEVVLEPVQNLPPLRVNPAAR